MKLLEERIRRTRNDLESILGYAIWSNAPAKTTGAVQRALDALNEVVVERPKPKLEKVDPMLKELNSMLEQYANVRETIKGTTERIGRVQTACEKYNEGLDAFFASADALDAALEAAPNGELGDEPAIQPGGGSDSAVQAIEGAI